MLTVSRYFNRSKLYYPNEETSRSSRKYVKAMKHLDVRSVFHSVPLIVR